MKSNPTSSSPSRLPIYDIDAAANRLSKFLPKEIHKDIHNILEFSIRRAEDLESIGSWAKIQKHDISNAVRNIKNIDSGIYIFIDNYLIIFDTQPVSAIEPFTFLDRIYVRTRSGSHIIVKLFQYPISFEAAPKEYILGVTRQGHDSSAAIIQSSTGQVIAFEREERTRRIKPARNFPKYAIKNVIEIAGIQTNQISAIAIGHGIHSFEDMPSSKSPIINQFKELGDEFMKPDFGTRHKSAYILERLQSVFPDLNPNVTPIYFIGHHIAHATSMPIKPDQVNKSLFLVMDGRGEWDTITGWIPREGDLKCILRIGMPNSIGYLYNMMGRFMGWREFGFEGQIMGLAPYGKPRNKDEEGIHKLLMDVYKSFAYINPESLDLKLNRKYFNGGYEPEKLAKIIGWASAFVPSKQFLEEISPYIDPLPSNVQINPNSPQHRPICILANAIQTRTQEIILELVRGLKQDFPEVEYLCLSGGVALNITTNGEIIRQGLFTSKKLITTPVPGDDGLSIGAALFLSNYFLKVKHQHMPFHTALLGRKFSLEEVRKTLDKFGLIAEKDYKEFKNFNELTDAVSNILIEGNGIAWFQGREEAGPRALGARSILFSATDSSSNLRANKAKKRQLWRPSALSLLREDAMKILKDCSNAHYMNTAFSPKPEYKKLIKAGTHPADGSTRPQVVTRGDAPHLYKLLKCLKKKTEVGIVLNTSFNRAEPIVHYPEDALNTLYYLEGVDYLAISNFLVKKGSYKPSIIATSEEPQTKNAYKDFQKYGSPANLVQSLLKFTLSSHQLRLIISERHSLPMFREAFNAKVLASVIEHIRNEYSHEDNFHISVYPLDSAHSNTLLELIKNISKESTK